MLFSFLTESIVKQAGGLNPIPYKVEKYMNVSPIVFAHVVNITNKYY